MDRPNSSRPTLGSNSRWALHCCDRMVFGTILAIHVHTVVLVLAIHVHTLVLVLAIHVHTVVLILAVHVHTVPGTVLCYSVL